jgi:hypothetical protein
MRLIEQQYAVAVNKPPQSKSFPSSFTSFNSVTLSRHLEHLNGHQREQHHASSAPPTHPSQHVVAIRHAAVSSPLAPLTSHPFAALHVGRHHPVHPRNSQLLQVTRCTIQPEPSLRHALSTPLFARA